MKIKFKIHSIIDVITNSSTEIFSNLTSDKAQEEIQKIIDDLITDFGCKHIEITILPAINWDSSEGDTIPGEWELEIDQCGEPCTAFINRLNKILGISN